MLKVLRGFLRQIVGCGNMMIVDNISYSISEGEPIDERCIQYVKNKIENWNKRGDDNA